MLLIYITHCAPSPTIYCPFTIPPTLLLFFYFISLLFLTLSIYSLRCYFWPYLYTFSDLSPFCFCSTFLYYSLSYQHFSYLTAPTIPLPILTIHLSMFFFSIVMCNFIHMHEYNLKQSQLYDSNYINFFKDFFQIIHDISLQFFFKSYISKICNGFSFYIYIYIYIYLRIIYIWFRI